MTCKVLLHHYGRFTSPPRRRFVGGLVATVDPVELERFSTNQVKIILKYSLGYDENSPTFLYLRKPNCSLDSGLVPLADALQDRNMLPTYAQSQQNRLHVYVSRVEISPLVVADQHKDEENKKEKQGKPSYLSTVLIPNDGSLEEAFAAHYKLQIYIDHLGVDFIIAQYIFPNALTEMMNHVITNYTNDSEDNKREVTQNDYTFNQLVEWAEQEHFEDEETKLSCPKIDLSTSMADSANDARKTIISNLQRELEADAKLANTMLGNLTRYSEQMRICEIQITMLQNMPTMNLNSYGLHALLMTHEADIRTTNNLIRARQELLRSIAEKQNFINNYRAI
ncbi:hypothetical protein Tco_0989128 [Tanacetum coccineum]|uniref:PB1-like domain-containing protein n=1 Tax=Tanacetum coccineum TaxID=301880 RepID=A0ABQ5ET92_9ASTR